MSVHLLNKKINHKISAGETFNNILEQYSINQKEISQIKKKLSKKINLNKLNSSHRIEFTMDQTNNLVKEFTFKISNKEKIYLSRDTKTNDFSQKILVTKLKKNILYKENKILKSLYKSAIDKKIPPNIIIEFARIYGFQVDFQRDIRKRDSFQIMYEIFRNFFIALILASLYFAGFSDNSLSICMLPKGSLATTSVNVPPRSTQKSHLFLLFNFNTTAIHKYFWSFI